jgi:hypothetical protein
VGAPHTQTNTSKTRRMHAISTHAGAECRPSNLQLSGIHTYAHITHTINSTAIAQYSCHQTQVQSTLQPIAAATIDTQMVAQCTDRFGGGDKYVSTHNLAQGWQDKGVLVPNRENWKQKGTIKLAAMLQRWP